MLRAEQKRDPPRMVQRAFRALLEALWTVRATMYIDLYYARAHAWVPSRRAFRCTQRAGVLAIYLGLRFEIVRGECFLYAHNHRYYLRYNESRGEFTINFAQSCFRALSSRTARNFFTQSSHVYKNILFYIFNIDSYSNGVLNYS